MPRGFPDSWVLTGALRLGRSIRRAAGGRGFAGRGKTSLFRITFSGVVLYKPILNYELNVPSGMVGRHMAALGAKIEAGAKAKVGVKTGMLKASIHTEHRMVGGRQYIKIGSNLHYALMHHEGTRPHIIAAKPPGVLRFTSKRGGLVHAATVMHPGTRPNRYLSSQLRKFIR